MTPVEQMAALLREREPTAIWGAGQDAITVINKLDRLCGLRPSVLIDNAKNKQGKRLLNIPIMSYDDAISHVPEPYIFIAAGMWKYQVIGQLVNELRVPPERIVNYEPVVWKRGCVNIECTLQSGGSRLQFCCSDFGKKTSPRASFDGDYTASIARWLALRVESSERIICGLPTSCDGCGCISESYYAAEPQIRFINFDEGGICNFNCIYCRSLARNPHGNYREDMLDLKNTLNAAKESGALAEDVRINFSPGEPALHRDRIQNYRAFYEAGSVCVMTNASVYDAELAQCLEDALGTIMVSVDAGTRETYHKVKGLDVYDKVRENLRKYAAKREGVVELKYIFLPEVNDKDADVEGFLALCREIGPGMVFLSYDMYHPLQTLPGQTLAAVRSMIAALDREGIIWQNLSDVIARALAQP